MTSVCLALNVRDAEAHIARCITSALKFPGVDRALFIDTGCTDGTINAIKSALNGTVPYEILEEEWVGHAHNRTILLAKSRETGADYTLQLDADMELVIEGDVPELDGDEYMLAIRDRGLIYPLPLLTSTKREFFYAGVAHSYLACKDGPSEGQLLESVALIDHGGGGHRPGKIERDAELLAAEVGKNPADGRSWFYLAQSYRDLDKVPEAIAAYKIRASLGGWNEEVYQALYQAGMLLCEHVNYYEGAKLLIAAAEMKQNRAEALRALAGCSVSVANKVPLPKDEVLFVEPGAYGNRSLSPSVPQPNPAAPQTEVPPLPDISCKVRRRRRSPITAKDVTAIIVTRGNVDLTPCLETLPYDQVVIWDNSKREHDYKIFGRYAAIPEAKHSVVYWQDDDIIFRNHDRLLAEYQPGTLLSNMDEPWIQGAGYQHTALVGAGSLCDAYLPAEVFGRYLEQFPWDDDLMTNPDLAFGTLVNWRRGDFGYEVRDFADDLDRLYQTPGQPERKRRLIDRCIQMQQGVAPAMVDPPLTNDRHQAIHANLVALGLRPGMDVYEIGCGTGTVTSLIAGTLAGTGSVLAIDIDTDRVATARQTVKQHTNVRIETLDGVTFRPGELFDVVVLPDVLEHIPAKAHRALFKNIARCLKPDGFALINMPNPLFLKWLRENKPEILQHPVDEPVPTKVLLAALEPANLCLHRLVTYTIWDKDDYQALVLRHAASFAGVA